ncbi:DNA-directed RNA polymerase subunit A'' [Halapricum hydrolyticum]|uniref:DNA-directed RNA polymerase subunit Rpo1C n=2 Tax=Halapricum hydrolyticum TaxID=2979991 RepID=A0AAE3ICM8_9EURY|nr:DNA-directed RNA polymerase subunit A'' [Halapricum hydrolyticum]MCU4726818.1 DNA-directed RNA polymerase subunit A'' [Halapricum hydrolyticum]
MSETQYHATDRFEFVDEDVELLVEDTDLPRRLKNELYETIDDRGGMDLEAVEEVASAVESRYVNTRVDPLDPVGTVSAQSIGEPGTQMSVPYDEKVLVRRDGETDVTEIGSLIDGLMAVRESADVDGHEVTSGPEGMEVLSLRADERVEWKPLEQVSRHEAPEELLRFELESGRSIRATKAHSFVVQDDSGDIVPIAGDELAVGDELPVAGEYDARAGEADVSTLEAETALTDGGVVASKASQQSSIVGTASWDRIESIETVEPDHEYVYDFSVAGLETFTTAQGVVTHNTMNTFHYAGVAEIDVTQGLPRLIELVDARKTPDTPMMTVHLEDEYATERERAHEVVWKIEATKILALGDISTNVADMLVQIDLNPDTLAERWPTVDDVEAVAEEIASTIESALGVQTRQSGMLIEFGPEEPSYRDLLQLVEDLREIVFKGIEDVSRVVIRKEETEKGEEFVLYTEGSALGDVLDIEGVDASRATCNNIHEIYRNLGVEAAREAIIDETMNTLEEQGLDDVNVRHLMLVADIMTNDGEIESIGRHGISGSKDSVLARAAFEVTVSHLLDAAIHGEVDGLDGVTENVIVGKPIKLGTGDVDLRMNPGKGGSTD